MLPIICKALALLLAVCVCPFQITSAQVGSFVSFETLEDLSRAVDLYLDDALEDDFLQIITTYGVMEVWDVSQITSFDRLFSQDRNPSVVQFQADLSEWDVSGAESLAFMFQGARRVNFDVSKWNVANAGNFSHMFDGAESFQGRGLAKWNVERGQDFTAMFRRATAFGTNPETNNLCAWQGLVQETAVMEDMFFESQCPVDSIDDLPVAPSLRATITRFCQMCNETASTPEPQQEGSMEQEVPTNIGTDNPSENNESFTKNDDASRPNILFLMTDQQRFDAIRRVQDELSHYDDAFKIDTPNLDRLSMQGAYFRNAYCQCAVCAPARTTIRTGCTIERTGIQHNDLAAEYDHGEIFRERVESLESLDHILVERYGYTSEYYGKWHMPEILYMQRSGDTSQPVVSLNDFDFTKSEFMFKSDESSRKIRRYYEQYEDLGRITRSQKFVNSTAMTSGRLPQLSNGNPQIDSYTRYPYIPIALDTRYSKPPGTDLKDKSLFESFEQSEPNIIGIFSLKEEEGTPTHFTGDIAIRALKRLKAESNPWFLTVSFHNPHPPFVAPYSDYFGKYWENRANLHIPVSLHDPMNNSAYSIVTNQLPQYKDPVKIQEWTAIYYAMVEEVDVKIGELLDTLGDAANNTLVIFTSDHGEMLGAHQKRSKNNFYEESSKVPLMMKFPDHIKSGTMVDEVVSHLDLFSTILDYAGAADADKSDGKSLRPFIEGTEYNKDFDEGDVVFAEWDFRKPVSRDSTKLDRDIDERPSFLVRKGKYKLMMHKLSASNGKDMMFDLDNDPFEMNNLLGKNAMTAEDEVIHKAEHMRCLLLDWMKRLDGQVGYFSDPAANYGDSNGDMREIRQRQQWKQLGFWVSDKTLKFGRLTKLSDGSFVRHEHLYMGTRNDEIIHIKSITITGPFAGWFHVDQDPIEFGRRDCKSIRVSLKPKQEILQGSSVDATLRLEVETYSPNISFHSNALKSVYNVRLAFDMDVHSKPTENDDAGQQDELDNSSGNSEGNLSSAGQSPSGQEPSDDNSDFSEFESSSATALASKIFARVCLLPSLLFVIS
jgi:arylsulfatase A-like enzyme